jgi:glycosyltransferase involved in cell wall biosynthesis
MTPNQHTTTPRNEHAPRVSIGLPVYNGENYLAEALDSLLTQTFDDFELIITDNASTDRTPEICNRYLACDSRVRYYRNEVNLGSAGNYGRSFALARGEYFKWAAHDDLCAPTFLARCVEVLDSRPEVVWCHSRSRHIDPHGDPLPGPENQNISYVALDGPNSPRRWTRESPRPSQRFAAVLLGGSGCLDLYGLARADVMRRTSLHLPYYGADKVFIAELSLQGRFFEIPETLFSCRVHPEASGNLTSADDQQRFINPRVRQRFNFTRLHLLRGYAGAVLRARLSPRERAGCLLALVRYICQVSKWMRVLRKTLAGGGTGGGYVEKLSALDESCDSARGDLDSCEAPPRPIEVTPHG